MSPEEGGEFVKMLRAVFSTIAVSYSINAGYLCILGITIMGHIRFPMTVYTITFIL